MSQTKKRLGGILVELGYLKPKDLFWGVKYQVQEIVASLFGMTEGSYEFIPGEIPPGEVITLHMSTANLIMQGIKRIDDWTRISRGIPPMETVLRPTSDPLKLYQDVDLSSEEKTILSLFDGKRTIKDAIGQSRAGDFEALKAVYVFFSIGMLEKEGGKPQKKPKAMARLDAEPRVDRTAIQKAYFDAQIQNHYEVLGLDSEASQEDIEPGISEACPALSSGRAVYAGDGEAGRGAGGTVRQGFRGLRHTLQRLAPVGVRPLSRHGHDGWGARAKEDKAQGCGQGEGCVC